MKVLSVENNILDFARSVNLGITIIMTHGTTTGLPNDTYRYSSGMILRRTDVIQIILYSYTNDIAHNTYRNGVWSVWKTLVDNPVALI